MAESLRAALAGPALFSWCEPDYAVSPWVAEWHNTWSNLAFVAVGLATVASAKTPPTSVLVPAGWLLVLVGLGSMAFHGLLTRWGQALDELAILWWEVALLWAFFPSQGSRRCIMLLLAAEMLAYPMMDLHPKVGWALYHPLHGCVDAALALSVILAFWRAGLPSAWRIVSLGILMIAIGLGGWLLDMFHCEAVRSLYLHAWAWHIFAAGAIGCLHLGMALILANQAGDAQLTVFGATFCTTSQGRGGRAAAKGD